MSADLPQASATIEPLVTYEEPVDLEGFVHMSLGEINTSFDLLEGSDDDVAPFAVIAEGPTIYLVQWRELDPELVDRFLTHVVPPTLAAREPEIAGLFLTTYLTDASGARFEAALFSVIETDGQGAREQSLAAPVQRSPDDGPQLGDWRLLENEVAPAIARALYQGMLGSLRGEDG